ncbi:MAG TPA: hypothetical protein VIV34_03010 [Pseudolabrys sp.]
MSSKRKPHKPKSSEKPRDPGRQERERDLEEGLEDTFPASDPVAITEPVVEVGKADRKK